MVTWQSPFLSRCLSKRSLSDFFFFIFSVLKFHKYIAFVHFAGSSELVSPKVWIISQSTREVSIIYLYFQLLIYSCCIFCPKYQILDQLDRACLFAYKFCASLFALL